MIQCGPSKVRLSVTKYYEALAKQVGGTTIKKGLNPLVDKIRTEHPGAYDDMDDAELTKKVLAKYPMYSDLAVPYSKAAPSACDPRIKKIVNDPDFTGLSLSDQKGVLTRNNHHNRTQHNTSPALKGGVIFVCGSATRAMI
jgi:hypothetical protein